MRYLALACDYDGTLAHHGRVDKPTLESLERLLASGRKLVLVTTSLLAVVSLLFALQALLDLRWLWLLYVLIVVQSCLSAIDQPARRTFIQTCHAH